MNHYTLDGRGREGIWYRPCLELLEDRTLLSIATNLGAIHDAAPTVAGFGPSLISGPLQQDLPIIAEGANALGAISGITELFTTVSTKLQGLDPSTITTQADLQQALGAGYTVNVFNTATIQITYDVTLAGVTVPLAAANSVEDFFGDGAASHYLSEIADMSGSASGQVGARHFTFVFGANANGFFVQQGTLLDIDGFTASLNLNGNVKVGEMIFDVGLAGTGNLDFGQLQVSIDSNVSGAALSDLGAHASLDVSADSQAELTGTATAKVLGIDLVQWSATLAWDFAAGGTTQTAQLSIPNAGAGAPIFQNQSSLQSALVGTMTDALGLSQFGAIINPLAQVPPELQDLIGFVGKMVGAGMNDSQMNPQSGIDSILNTGSIQFANASDLLNIVSGNTGNLVTYTPPDLEFLNVPINPTISIPGFSILGVVNFLFTAGLQFNATGSASLGLGIDTSGVFLDTQETNITFKLSASLDIGIAVNVVGLVNLARGTIGPQFTTSARLGLDDRVNNTPQDGKVHLDELLPDQDQSGTISGIGSWLSDALELTLGLSGAIKLEFIVFTPIGGFIDVLPEPVGAVLAPIADAAGVVTDFFTGAVETICNVVEDVPILGDIVDEVADCHDVRKAAQLAFGDYIPVLEELVVSLGGKKVAEVPNQSATFQWLFTFLNVEQKFSGGDAISGGQDPAATPPNSDPADFIEYHVDGSKLTIIGKPGTDNVRILDRGNGAIELQRTGIDAGGVTRIDPTRIFTGITSFDVTLNSSAGSNSSFIMDQSLAIDATVRGGAGDDRITTGAGNDTVFGGDGKDRIDGGDGANVLKGDNGDDTIYGGAGTNTLSGGANNDLLVAGSGVTELFGDTGDDRLLGGSGPDVFHGGGGNDRLVAGTGTATMFGDGGPNDFNSFVGGSASVIMFGGLGHNLYSTGSGFAIINGGPGADEVTWEVGDGDADIDLGADTPATALTNVLQVIGSTGVDAFVVGQNGSTMGIAAPGAIISADNIRSLGINGSGDADTLEVNDVSATSVRVVTLNLDEVALVDGAQDLVILNGPPGTRTVNIGEQIALGNLEFRIFGVIVTVPVPGPVMAITGLGPTFLLTNTDNAAIANLAPGDDTVNIDTRSLPGPLTVNGNVGVNVFNVFAVSGPTIINALGGRNTFFVGEILEAGLVQLEGIVAGLTLNGSGGADTAYMNDSGDADAEAGTLTPTTLTGLGMGEDGITYTGLSFLNVYLGTGDNPFAINDINPLTVTWVHGGNNANDRVTAKFVADFNGSLTLLDFEAGTVDVTNNFNGFLSDTLPGNLQRVTVGGALTPTGQLIAGNVDSMTIGPDLYSAGHDMAGRITVLGTLTDLRVAGGTPGFIVADRVGSVRTYGGFGPVVLRIQEHGVQRRIEAAVPAQPYPLTPLPPVAPPPASPAGSRFQYYYESGALANPQMTIRVTNSSGNNDPNQYDVSLVAYGDAAKLNLARLDAAGVTGIRNVAIEGDLLSAVTQAASAFFKLPGGGVDTTPAGVRLPQDALAGVGVRDFAPNGFIQAASIQGISFGSFTSAETGQAAPASEATAQDAEALLAAGTEIVRAENTFRIPFASSQPVAFFMDDAILEMNSFDPDRVIFTDQGGADARGAVTALVTVAPPTDSLLSLLQEAMIETIALRGDGGAIYSEQPITEAITSTGPLGDVILNLPLLDLDGILSGNLDISDLVGDITRVGLRGLVADIAAPSIIGTIDAQTGTISSTIQTTGLRTDPITGVVSAIPANFGRVITQDSATTATTVHAVGGISGRIISRGNLVSQVVSESLTADLLQQLMLDQILAVPGITDLLGSGSLLAAVNDLLGQLLGLVDLGGLLGSTPLESLAEDILGLNGLGTILDIDGGIRGVIAAQGNIGARVGTQRLGGIVADGSLSGEVVALIDILGDVELQGMTGGRIATRGGIRGNLTVHGTMDRNSAIVSRGVVGDAALGTSLKLDTVLGIVAAKGAINLGQPTITVLAAFFRGNLGNGNPNAAAIDAIFTNGGQALSFDRTGQDLAGLELILADLNNLRVSNGNLTGTAP